jgi:hypothetical protein
MLRGSMMAVMVWALGIVSSAQAAPCAGFADVDDSSQFCANVAWMKNRGITLGCSAGLYCPDDPVTRLSMAAFISRLDRVLPPTVIDANGIAAGPLLTFTETLAQTYYRRSADAFSLLMVNAPPGASPPSYSWSHTFAFFQLPNCNGTGAIYASTTLLVPIVGKLGLVVRGPGGARNLYTVPVYPPPALTGLSTQSFLNNGVCTNFAQSLDGYAVTFVEDLALKFLEPFTIK